MADNPLLRTTLLQKALLEEMGLSYEETREQLGEELEPGDRLTGRLDGHELGEARRDRVSTKLSVVNPGAYEAWVAEHIPTAIVTVRQVSAAFTSGLLRGDGTWTNPETGQVFEVPGLGWRTTGGNVVVLPADDARKWAQEVLGKSLAALEDSPAQLQELEG